MYTSQLLYLFFCDTFKNSKYKINKIEYSISNSLNNKYINIDNYEIQEL
jgi:hypothetical protein